MRRVGTRRAGRAAILLLSCFVVAAVLTVIGYFGIRRSADEDVRERLEPALELARERAAGHFARDERGAALKALEPLLRRPEPDPQDLVSAAICQAGNGDYVAARELLTRAQTLAPESPRVHFNLGRLAFDEGDFATAEVHFRKTLAGAPEDYPTRIMLARAIEETKPEEARRLYDAIRNQGIDHAGSWYLAAIFRLASMLRLEGEDARAAELYQEHAQYESRGVKSPDEKELVKGTFGRIGAPPPLGGPGPALVQPWVFGPPAGFAGQPGFALIAPELAGAKLNSIDADNDGLADLLGHGANGLWLALHASDGTWTTSRLAAGPIEAALCFDLGNDDDLDVVFVGADHEPGLIDAVRDPATRAVAWRTSAKQLPSLNAGGKSARELLAVDYDHEGDLDLAIVGDFGARLWRNDGADKEGGAFTDVTAEAGLPSSVSRSWIVSEDFDTDQDVDLLLGGAEGIALASNLRGGKFEDLSAKSGLQGSPIAPIVGDVAKDARPDLWSPASISTLWVGKPSGRFERASLSIDGVPTGRWVQALDADLDLDAFVDVIGLIDGGSEPDRIVLVRGLWAPGDGAEASHSSKGSFAPIASEHRSIASLAVDDFDGDLAPDLALSVEGGVAIYRNEGRGGNALRLGFRGKKDNRRAIGAIVELRDSSLRYQRHYWRGEARIVGVGDATSIAWRRITWPNGIVQWDMSPDLGDRTMLKDALGGLEQSEGLMGSCPFLYAWNGRENVFVSDVLGITPLGLPMAPGMLVPPDHDEYVLVRGDQLAPKEGFFELHFTEELREVTYLDRIRLDVVDHPIGTEVYPNERFCFPPFPEARIHTVREPLAPTRAIGSDGRDWTAELAASDERFAAPFAAAPSQFLGLATPHFLELEFDRDAVAKAAKLRLVMHGWFYWTDASVNLASARDPAHEFIPPIVQVPDGNGGWRDAGPPIGFPAGKTKTMVVDVGELLVRDDPRIRLFSSLRLYWDSIRLAVDADDAQVATASIEPTSASLWRRGFSAQVADGKTDQPERFEWHRLADVPRWNPHPGLYTKYGESLELVTAVDDCFVVMATGDALTVRFDASQAPPLREGFARDYLVFLDGWAKDRDPNTVEALFTEPLPFHGMSAYPYGPTERFPDNAKTRAWRRDWLVRDALEWFEPWSASLVQRSFEPATIEARN